MMKHGFTTGSCAAAASKAAAIRLLTAISKDKLSITTPKGLVFEAEILDMTQDGDSVTCSVLKDGGDDPDITTGSHITATVSFWDEPGVVVIDGGKGVGRVTKPGLDRKVGEAAINSVPRSMIEKEVRDVMTAVDYEGGLKVVIFCPEGEEKALRTFNPRLGIEGGISILGTSGVVEPMSRQALIDTIKVEMSQKMALGYDPVAVSPGNYGLDFMKSAYAFDLDMSVKCSNFIGETVDLAVELGFTKMLLTGHVGKLIKVAGGIMNTHSREADCRMELLSAFALKAGADADTCREILQAVTTEEGIRILKEAGLCDAVMKMAVENILFYLDRRSMGKLHVEVILYSQDYGELGRSEDAVSFVKAVRRKNQLIAGSVGEPGEAEED